MFFKNKGEAKKVSDLDSIKSYTDAEDFIRQMSVELEFEKKRNPIRYYSRKMWNKLDLKARYYNIKYGIKNLIKWFPVIWRDRDWDQGYLLLIMNHKMKTMSELHEKHGSSENSDLYAAQLLYCSELAHRIADERYHEHPEVSKLYKEGKYRESFDLEEKLIQNDIDELFDYMNKNIRYWWD